jgi:glutamate racemase
MSLSSSQPIGIFDSGVGGLTVANAIKQLLPDEQLIYFGDTLHLPYGDKSAESVKYYSVRIADFLLAHNCKTILIACNTASAFAYKSVVEHIGNKALVFNVIDPVVSYVKPQKFRKIGVIGTKGTINSGTYETMIAASNPDQKVVSLATPLLVPMIEEGFIFDDISNAIIRSYLSNEQLSGIDALILGCTHYPIIKNQISKYYNFNIDIVDSARIVANKVKEKLQEENLLNHNPDHAANKFFISDYTEYFEKISRMFFEQAIHLEKIDLWKE